MASSSDGEGQQVKIQYFYYFDEYQLNIDQLNFTEIHGKSLTDLVLNQLKISVFLPWTIRPSLFLLTKSVDTRNSIAYKSEKVSVSVSVNNIKQVLLQTLVNDLTYLQAFTDSITQFELLACSVNCNGKGYCQQNQCVCQQSALFKDCSGQQSDVSLYQQQLRQLLQFSEGFVSSKSEWEQQVAGNIV